MEFSQLSRDEARRAIALDAAVRVLTAGASQLLDEDTAHNHVRGLAAVYESWLESGKSPYGDHPPSAETAAESP